MYRNGTEISTIGTETKLSERTIYRVVKSLGEKPEKSNPEDGIDMATKPEQEKERPLDVNLKRRTEQKIVEYSSDVLLRDFKLEMVIARVLHEKELRYRASVEEMGMRWETFVRHSMDLGYELIKQTWEDEVQYMVTIEDLQTGAIIKASADGTEQKKEEGVNEYDE
jgi:hypothetical protein